MLVFIARGLDRLSGITDIVTMGNNIFTCFPDSKLLVKVDLN